MTETSPLIPSASVKAEASALGFYACGLSPAAPLPPEWTERYRNWLAEGCQACMDYLNRHAGKRADVGLLYPGARTVISVALNYQPVRPLPTDRWQLAWYAYGRDYHEVMKERLQTLLQRLQTRYPLQGRAFCDTAPVAERYWAWRGGLGWIGRHSQLVVPGAGSAFFLGELVVDLPADIYDTPTANRCGTCRRCTDACPTQAIRPDGTVDARRCLSYLTIEHRGDIPPEQARHMYPYFYGCDRCLSACPHLNRRLPSDVPDFVPRPELYDMQPADWQQLSRERYQQLFKGSAVKRAKFEGLSRNIEAMQKPCPPGNAEETDKK